MYHPFGNFDAIYLTTLTPEYSPSTSRCRGHFQPEWYGRANYQLKTNLCIHTWSMLHAFDESYKTHALSDVAYTAWHSFFLSKSARFRTSMLQRKQKESTSSDIVLPSSVLPFFLNLLFIVTLVLTATLCANLNANRFYLLTFSLILISLYYNLRAVMFFQNNRKYLKKVALRPISMRIFSLLYL